MKWFARLMAAVMLGSAMLAPLGCSPQATGPQPPAQADAAREQPTPAQGLAARQTAPATPPRELTSLEDVCTALLPDASLEELRAVFGDGAFHDEEGNLYVSAGEGLELGPVRSQHVNNAIIGFEVRGGADTPPKWRLYDIQVGDSWSAVQQVNGNPFREVDDGIDWNKGKLDQDGCIYSATFEMPLDMPPDASPSKYGILSSLSMRWRRDRPVTTTKIPLPAPVPVETRRSFEEICSRLREDMSPEDLRKVLGPQNLREVDPGTWTAFPDDPRRTFTVSFQSWEEDGPKWRVYAIIIDNPASTWALPNGVGMGDSAAAVEKTVGGPFTFWRHSVTTGGGAILDKDNANLPIACSYHPSFRHDRALVDSNHIMSDDPAFLAWRPYVESIRVDWRGF